MIEIKVTGEVVTKIKNALRGSSGTFRTANHYFVLRLPEKIRLKNGAVKQDHIPVEVFNSNTDPDQYIDKIKVGYEVEVTLYIEAFLWTDEVIVNSFIQKDNYTMRTPKIYPKFKLKQGWIDKETKERHTFLRVLKFNDIEGRDEANTNFKGELDPADDLPF